jgi:hypothetical protein
VAEASGLGDVGDAVGDEPGLVAVPEPVKDQAGGDGVDADVRAGSVVVAVGGGAHGAAGEVGSAE